MIQFFRRTIIESVKQSCREQVARGSFQRLSSVKGQVGLVLILLAAVGLIFYAVSLNLRRASDAKNKTMIAAESAASFMASFMASYAQKMSEENLKGKLKYCQSTSLLKRIIKAVFLVILAIITHNPYFIAAAIMAVAAAAIDAVLIQPTLTDMWNKMIRERLSIEGQLTEFGIQQALSVAVSDNVEFPDLLDSDMDGAFGWKNPGNIAEGANDYISRFSYYYTKRIGSVVVPDVAPLYEFIDQLEDFVFYLDQEDEDGDLIPDDVWGLHDVYMDNPSGHVCDNAGTRSAECDPCCVPARDPCCDISGCETSVACNGNYLAPDGGDDPCCNSCSEPPASQPAFPHFSCDFEGLDPTECPMGNAHCVNTSFMGAAYPYVYDPFYEDTTNSILSFREQIGRDDESPLYRVEHVNPDWHRLAGTTPATHQTSRPDFYDPGAPAIPIEGGLLDAHKATTQGPEYWYRIQDTTGFYPTDSYSRSAYQLFYALQDFGVDLSVKADPYLGYDCYWKEGACDGIQTGTVVNDMGVYETYRGLTPLAAGSLAPFWMPLISGGLEVKDLGAGGIPDVVPNPGGIFLADSDCGDSTQFGWKRGSDRFCSTAYPYYVECAKHEECIDAATGDEGDNQDLPRDCFCGEAPDSPNANPPAWNPKFFPKDVLEDMYYGLPEFSGWAVDFIHRVRSDPSFMRKAIREWYDEIARWIEPRCDDATCEPGDDTCCEGSFTKSPDDGFLYAWRNELEALYDSLDKWMLQDSYIGGAGNCLGANAVWCVPAATPGLFNQYGREECPGVTEQEETLFDVNENTVRGDLVDVVACLDYNVNDIKPFMDPYTGTTGFPRGNHEKFQACADYCGPWTCAELPRSLSVLDPMVPKENLYPLTWSDYELYVYCLQSATYTQCAERCDPAVLPMVNSVSGAAYPINAGDYNPPDVEIFAIELEYQKWKTRCQLVGSYQTTLTCNGPPEDITTCDPLVEEPKFDNCIDSWITGSCEAFVDGVAPDAYAQGVIDTIAAADNSTGSCHQDADGNGTPDLVEWAQRSANTAANLVIKLGQRLNFLQYVLTEAVRVHRILGEGVDRFDEFLSNNTAYNVGPLDNNNQSNTDNERILGNDLNYRYPELERDVEWLTEGRHVDDEVANPTVYEHYQVDSPAELMVAMRYDERELEDLPSVLVYVWRDGELPADKPRSDGSRLGYAHAVKVEVRAPTRCNNACSPDALHYQRWPTIKTKTKSWGTKRCYYLVDYQGLTKARVIRWDEPKDTVNVFRFANNVPIWGTRVTHPDMSGGFVGGVFDDDPATGICFNQAIDPIIYAIGKDVEGAGGPAGLWHAFMLNEIPYLVDDIPVEYDQCWQQVHQNMLQHGVHSESCATYRWESSPQTILLFGLFPITVENGDFGVRFVPCDREFLLGNN